MVNSVLAHHDFSPKVEKPRQVLHVPHARKGLSVKDPYRLLRA